MLASFLCFDVLWRCTRVMFGCVSKASLWSQVLLSLVQVTLAWRDFSELCATADCWGGGKKNAWACMFTSEAYVFKTQHRYDVPSLVCSEHVMFHYIWQTVMTLGFVFLLVLAPESQKNTNPGIMWLWNGHADPCGRADVFQESPVPSPFGITGAP